jgi:hypothetical protein
MKKENLELAIKHLYHFETLEKGEYVNNLDNQVKDDLVKIGREEFFGIGWNPDMWCGSCIARAIKDIYERIYNYLTHHRPKAEFDYASLQLIQFKCDVIKILYKLYFISL